MKKLFLNLFIAFIFCEVALAQVVLDTPKVNLISRSELENLSYVYFIDRKFAIVIDDTTNQVSEIFSIQHHLAIFNRTPIIKNGSYFRIKNGVVVEKGYFKCNKKDGLWITFDFNGGLLSTSTWRKGKLVI